MAQSLKSIAARGIRWTTLSALVVTSAQLLQLYIASQIVSPSEFGLFSIVLLVLGFLRIFADGGFTFAVIHLQEMSDETLASIYWMTVVVGVSLYGAAAILGAPLVAWAYGEPRLHELIALGALSFIVVPFGLMHGTLMRKRFEFDVFAKIEVLAALAGPVGMVAAAWAGYNVTALIFGVLMTNLVRCGLLVAVGSRSWRPMFHLSFRSAKYALGFGLYQVGDRFANYLASRSDQILIGAFLGPEILGYYALAWNTIVQPVYRINPILNRVFAPILATVQDDLPRLRRGFLILIGLTAMVNMPLIAGFAAIAPIFVPTVFGTQWVPAVPILQILAVVAAVKAVGNPTGALIVARGRPDLAFRWSVAGTVLQFPILWWAVQSASILVVTATLAALQLLALAGLYVFVHRPLLGPCLGPWLRQIGVPVVFATVMAAVVAYAASALDLENPLKLLIGIALGALTYGGLYGILQRQAIVDLTRIAIAR